jgi:hypothetical protein
MESRSIFSNPFVPIDLLDFFTCLHSDQMQPQKSLGPSHRSEIDVLVSLAYSQ